MKIYYEELLMLFLEKLLVTGFPAPEAETMAATFANNTFDGIFTHGINRFPRFIRDVKEDVVKISGKPSLVKASGAMEQWDGNLGPGILNALHCTERTISLAEEFGIGTVALRNTNHWMRAGTYGRIAARKGFMLIAWTNTIPNMPAWGGEKIRVGNNPIVVAIPYGDAPLVLDMAMSQFAYGKLEWMQKTGQQLPVDGGYNGKGELTKDPAEIMKTERILPAGLWKGSGFAIVLDLAAAILAAGKTSGMIGKEGPETGISQIFIALDTEKYINQIARETLIRETLEYIQKDNEGAGYPGKRVMQNRKEFMENGVEIPDELWEEIREL